MIYSSIYFQYWYELYVDDLPMWGMVGETLRDEKTGQMLKVQLIYKLHTIIYILTLPL